MPAPFSPNRVISPATAQLIAWTQLGIFLVIWMTSPNAEILPRPPEVLDALKDLWFNQGLSTEWVTSMKLNLESLALSTAISLLFSYSTVLPVMRPLVAAISKGRFLSLVGFSLVFTLVFNLGGHNLKVALLTFGMTVFYLTSMAAVIEAIPKSEFDHARTLRMGEWRVVWEVVVLGTIDKAFEVMRQNAAIGWMMLTMVEGIVKSEGGIGVLLINSDKYMRLPQVFAIQIVILITGLFLDYVIGVLRITCCPYADLTLERG
jgi:NitT/TauT family transport system permease protein